ncbi:ABC transporter permease subunit [Mesorhizobium sp. BR1-1-16]|uniref:ABC transporter permease n=1 Tax=Mesorhizobium sp. BR1-1-16 TaxID=2876653 RepID=UPI001CCCAD8E|nr:ABC transporter permease subunit [Mesorhizobium sp. BR1-1-16]MBZ9939019.1 ABC transporter permease subunit [Mesorhizobium sp. BR1-1-16]
MTVERTEARRFPVGLLLVAAPVLLVAVFVLLPAIAAIVSTLRPDAAGWSFSAYARFFGDRLSTGNLLFTLVSTLVTSSALLLLCLPIALYLRFSSGRLPTFVQSVAVFPLFVPGIIVGYALIRFMGPNGTIQTVLHAIGINGFRSPYLTPVGTVIGLVWEGIPLTLLILLSGLAQVPDAAIEAARDVGAGGLRILTGIILPLIRNSLTVAFSLSFLGVFGAFTMPYLLGPASPEMMGVFMQRTFSELQDPLQAQTQAVMCFLFCAVVGVIYVRSVARSRRKSA